MEWECHVWCPRPYAWGTYRSSCRSWRQCRGSQGRLAKCIVRWSERWWCVSRTATVEEYVQAYAVVAWHIGRVIDFPCDMSCKNPTRPCYASYDEEAFCKPLSSFSLAEFLKEHPDKATQIMEELNVNLPHRTARQEPLRNLLRSLSRNPKSGILRTFFNDFLAHNAFPEQRMISCSNWVNIARYKGLSDEWVETTGSVGCGASERCGCPPKISSRKWMPDIVMWIKPKLSDYQYVIMLMVGTTKDQGLPWSHGRMKRLRMRSLKRTSSTKTLPAFRSRCTIALPDLLVHGLEAAQTAVKRKRPSAAGDACQSELFFPVCGWIMPTCATLLIFIRWALPVQGAARGLWRSTLFCRCRSALSGRQEQDGAVGLATRSSWHGRWKSVWPFRRKRVPTSTSVPSLGEAHAQRFRPISRRVSWLLREEAGAQRGDMLVDMPTNAMKQDCGKAWWCASCRFFTTRRHRLIIDG